MELLENALGSNAFDLVLIGASFFLFQALSRALRALGWYPKSLERNEPGQWRWRNLTKSAIHAAISGTWALHAYVSSLSAYLLTALLTSPRFYSYVCAVLHVRRLTYFQLLASSRLLTC